MNRLKGIVRALSRVMERFSDNRTVLAVTSFRSLQTELRVLSFQHGWHLLFATNLDAAVRLRMEAKVAVTLYDRNLGGIEWPQGLSTILRCAEPTCVILLSHEVNNTLRNAALEYGGYDVVRDPFDGDGLARVVNGAFSLATAVDSAAERYDLEFQRDHRLQHEQ
jgi:DNA-binding response OmpR family regulator